MYYCVHSCRGFTSFLLSASNSDLFLVPRTGIVLLMARENNQTRFFLEDRFYELHKKELADMMKKQAEEARKAAELQKKLDTATGIAAKFDDGFTFGFGKKASGAFNGIFAGAMDALLTDKTFGQAYADRYHEIVGDAVQKGKQFEEEHPAAAMTTELVGSVLNPVNRAGGGALLSVGKAGKNATKLQKAATLGKTALASGAIGAGTGALTAAGQAQSLDEFGDRVVSDTLSGGVLGAVMPGAEAAVKKAWTVAAPKASAAFRTFNKLENSGAMKNVNNAVDKAVAKDRAMLEVADDTVNGLLREARQQTPAANEILDNAYGKISQGEAARTQREIERFAGVADVDHLVNEAKRHGEPAFNRLKNIEDVDAYALGREMVKRYPAGNHTRILKSIRRNMEKNDPNFKMGITKDGKIDYPHFLKDRQRAEYISTLSATYKAPEEVISGIHNGQPREYFLRKYYNPETKVDVYDMAIKADDGTLINKIAREGRNGNKEFEKLRQARASTDGTTSRTGQMESASVPAGQRAPNISPLGRYVKRDKFVRDIVGQTSQVAETGRGLGLAGATPIPNAARESSISVFDDYVNRDKVIQDELLNIRQNGFRLPGADKLPDTSFDMLNEVNRGLNEKIAAARNAGQFDTAANLERHQQELWRQMDGVLPGYGEARSFTDAAQRIPAAEQLGQNIFNPDLQSSHLSQAVSGMNSYEMQGLKSGVGDALKRETGNGAAHYGNIFSPSGQQKLGTALGQPGNRSLRGFLGDNVVAQNNRNYVMSGNTLAPAEQGIFGRLSSPWRNSQNTYFAQTMTGTPEALRQQYNSYVRGQNYYSPYAVPYLAQQYVSGD